MAEVLAYDILDAFDRGPLVVHVPGLQRNVLTNVAPGTVFVLEAEQIALVSKSSHTSAEAGQFSKNLRHILCNLVRRTGLRIFRKVARIHGVNEFRPEGRYLYATTAYE